jgi:hypothetical protein
MTDQYSVRTQFTLLQSTGRREFKARFVRAGKIRGIGNKSINVIIEAAALKAAVDQGMFEGKAVFVDHSNLFQNPSVRNLAGVTMNARWNEDEQSVDGTISLYSDAYPIATIIDEMLSDLKPPDVGLSIVFWPQWAPHDNEKDPRRIIEISHVESVDLVFEPAADGRITPACIVVPGDLTDYAEGAEDTAVLAFLNGLGPTWYAACGNHDVYGDGRTPAQWATAYGMDGRDFYKDIGDPAFARLIFLGVNNASSPHTLDATALSNLDTWVAATSLPTVIVTHFPPYNSSTHTDITNYYSSVQSNWYLKDQAAIWTILKAYDHAVAWVYGHIHTDMSATGLVHTKQIGTHLFHEIAASSIYYTNKVVGESVSAIVTAYITITATGLTVLYRDHTRKKFIKRFSCAIQSSLPVISPELSDSFSNDNELDVGNGYSTHQCDGAGGLEILDANGVISITGGQLVINGTPASNEGFVGQRPILRAAGRAMRLDMPTRTTVPSTNLAWGFGTNRLGSKVLSLGTGIDNNGTIFVRGPAGTAITTDFTSAAYRLTTGTVQTLLIMRSKGGLILARDDSFETNYWRIIYVYSTDTSDLYAKLLTSGAASNLAFDNLWVGDLGGTWATDYGSAAVYDAAPDAGDTYTAPSGNTITEFTWTAATGVSVDIMVRRTDDNNTWIVRCDQAGSTIKLISKSGGTETERASAAFTWVDGTDYVIQIIMSTIGTTHGQRVMVDDVAKLAATTNFQATVTGVKVPAGKNLAIWSRDIQVVL